MADPESNAFKTFPGDEPEAFANPELPLIKRALLAFIAMAEECPDPTPEFRDRYIGVLIAHRDSEGVDYAPRAWTVEAMVKHVEEIALQHM